MSGESLQITTAGLMLGVLAWFVLSGRVRAVRALPMVLVALAFLAPLLPAYNDTVRLTLLFVGFVWEARSFAHHGPVHRPRQPRQV